MPKQKKRLKDKLSQLPDSPGVYLFKDSQNQIIYIGKAKSLKKRVRSYFRNDISNKNRRMVEKIADIDYRVLPQPEQAQLLEAALIKEKQPHYNVSLKDDKSFPLIRISQEKFPIVSFCRRKKNFTHEPALYYGPYTNAEMLRQSLKLIRKIFGFRSCKRLPKSACLYWRLKLCPAPCIGKISAQDYRGIIQQIKLFLEYKHEELIADLREKMQRLAQEKKFEEASQMRDRLLALSSIAKFEDHGRPTNVLEDLKTLLALKKVPQRIEAFDLSNIFGQQPTGALVSFWRGLPDKKNYRRFRIKTVQNLDDYAMLREIIRRRFSRLIKENLKAPDLVLIDGGKAHLSVAAREIKKLGLSLSLASIAKDRENIYTLTRAKPLKLSADTPALNLIRRVRNEAHRFALSYHRLLRKKRLIA